MENENMLKSSDVEWVVNNLGELGVKIGNQVFFCYKGESLQYSADPGNNDMFYRPIGKREFGEVISSNKYAAYDDPDARIPLPLKQI